MQTDLKLALNTIGLLQIDYNELNDTYAKVDQLLKYFKEDIKVSGYVIKDLILDPDITFFAIVAIPKNNKIDKNVYILTLDNAIFMTSLQTIENCFFIADQDSMDDIMSFEKIRF